MRKYKSGMRWAFWRWTDVRTDYIRRLHIIKTPWFAICLHWLNHPDPDPHLHDHPVNFLSIILRGWYRANERSPVGWILTKRHQWFNIIRATDKHRIVLVKPGTMTLCFMGPKVQEWGFFVDGKKVFWKEYYGVTK